MSTPVDAERAWADLQRIRVPQERVYDEVERRSTGGHRSVLPTAAIMWLFIASWGLELPGWGFWPVLAAYVALLAWVGVRERRKARMQLHRSHYTWRSTGTFFAALAVVAVVVPLSGWLVRWAELPCGSLVQATLTAGAFLAVVPPATRWSNAALRPKEAASPGPGEAPHPQEASR